MNARRASAPLSSGIRAPLPLLLAMACAVTMTPVPAKSPTAPAAPAARLPPRPMPPQPALPSTSVVDLSRGAAADPLGAAVHCPGARLISRGRAQRRLPYRRDHQRPYRAAGAAPSSVWSPARLTYPALSFSNAAAIRRLLPTCSRRARQEVHRQQTKAQMESPWGMA